MKPGDRPEPLGAGLSGGQGGEEPSASVSRARGVGGRGAPRTDARGTKMSGLRRAQSSRDTRCSIPPPAHDATEDTRPSPPRAGRPAKAGETHKTAASTLSLYLREIGERKLLTPEEEKALAVLVQKGNEDARQRLIEANLRLVVHIAKRYARRGDPELFLDLIQEGNFGLFRAVERFDPTVGTRFSTYATHWIRQAIQRALMKSRTIRIPEHILEGISQMRKTRHRLYQDLGRQPTSAELAVELELSERELAKLEEAVLETVSLEKPIRGGEEGEEAELGTVLADLDTPQPEFIANQRLLRHQVRDIVDALPARDRKIVSLRFGLQNGIPKTLAEVAKEFGISRERVRQIQERALARIRAKEASSARLR